MSLKSIFTCIKAVAKVVERPQELLKGWVSVDQQVAHWSSLWLREGWVLHLVLGIAALLPTECTGKGCA